MKYLHTNDFILIIILAGMSQFSLTADIAGINQGSAINLENQIENAHILIKKLKTKYGTDKPQSPLNPILKQLAMISAATAVGAGTAYSVTDKIHDFGNRWDLFPMLQNFPFENLDHQIVAFICGLGTVGLGVGSITYLILIKLFQDPYVNTQELKDVVAELREIEKQIISAVQLQ
ncbi:hypothetical protein JST56_04905 [Candidatus Dependentiae bacterium]|nr:hypothetical protein [Candidatus Dependentiae bacterium]